MLRDSNRRSCLPRAAQRARTASLREIWPKLWCLARVRAGTCIAPVLFGVLIASGAMPDRAEAQNAEALQARYAKAEALFAERCKTAGAVIKRTIKDVEGIELKKVRPKLGFGDPRYFDPMFEGAAMAGESQGEDYVASFLYSEIRKPNSPDHRGVIQPPHRKSTPFQEAPRRGYRYVDVRDAVTGELQRYQVAPGLTDAEWRKRGAWARDLERSSPVGKSAPFAVDYEDFVDPADRAYWIAGTRIKVIDQRTGEVIAQLTRFVWDPGFGASGTGRWPWQHANSRMSNLCPATELVGHETRFFVDTVLVPKQGD